jgi:hypothetical protein
MPKTAWSKIPLIMLPAQLLLVKMGSHELFARAGLINFTSQIARIIGVGHYALPQSLSLSLWGRTGV